jgi:threonine dehydrogenase-like Zn-dependent dehydrogenase
MASCYIEANGIRQASGESVLTAIHVLPGFPLQYIVESRGKAVGANGEVPVETNPGIVFQAKKMVVFRDDPVPSAAAGEVVIKTRVTMISTGTELTILEADEFAEGSAWARYGKLPFSPGYNNVGVVVAAGSPSEEHWVGKRVATYSPHRLFVTAKVDELRVVPGGLDDEVAVFFTFAEIAMQGTRRGRLQWGEVAIVYGAGLIGQMVSRFVLFAGARLVFVVDVSEERLSLLPKHHRLAPVGTAVQDVKTLVAGRTAGRMADLVYETTGNSKLIPQEFAALRVEGRIVIVSSPRGSTVFDFQDLCGANSYTIIGSHNRSHTPVSTWENPWTQKHDGELFFELQKNGDIDVRPLITHRVPYAQAIDMYAMLMSDRTKAAGVLLDWR